MLCFGATCRRIVGAGLVGIVAFVGLLGRVGRVSCIGVGVVWVLSCPVIVNNEACAVLLSLEDMHFFCTCADTLRSMFCRSCSRVGTGPPGRAFINAWTTDTGSMTGGSTGVMISNPGELLGGLIIGDIHSQAGVGDGVGDGDGLCCALTGMVAITGVTTWMIEAESLILVG